MTQRGFNCRAMLCMALAITPVLKYVSTAQVEPASTRIPAVQKAEISSDQHQKPCLQPTPLFTTGDYEGPLKKLVVYFSRKPEIKTIHIPPATLKVGVCSLSTSEKFRLFAVDSFEPVTFVGAAFNAGVAQAADDDPSFGQGSGGYAKRYGAAFTDQISDNFFHTFFFPTVFRQDPRYYRKVEGSARQRLGYALAHVFVARTDAGKKTFNFSEWLGTGSSTTLSNLYHPGNERGFGPAMQRVGIGIGTDMGFDVLREFWPEIVRKLRLPFRTRGQQVVATQPPP